jgi:hypothetical protein
MRGIFSWRPARRLSYVEGHAIQPIWTAWIRLRACLKKKRGGVKDQPPRRDRSRNLGFPFPFAGFRAGFPRQVRAVLFEGEGVFLQADLRIEFGFPAPVTSAAKIGIGL